ncbi:MAG TPA: shikimate dehydrogenase [Syntrophales bacterium]|nr:shikimate dehydrogenase [Syntrophales bacterium]HPQ44047.1 shikimate dehydrogenase [Syntrophales bacterium]
MKNESRIYALFGNPVTQSLSPLMHNMVFSELKIDASYRAIRIEDARGIPGQMRALGISGASITIPHKTGIMPYLDTVSDSAERIGAVNTITHTDGRLLGDNTDWTGLVLALSDALEVQGKRFVILGAGGAARAAVYGIINAGGTPVIVNRTKKKGEQIAREFDCDFYPLDQIRRVTGDCLINTTPVGMFPDMDASPVDIKTLERFQWVMDTIYNPLETRLLKDATRAGLRTVSGDAMFVHQGAQQIRIWTGLEPPTELMKRVVLERLSE